jgi:hypothetical protein
MAYFDEVLRQVFLNEDLNLGLVTRGTGYESSLPRGSVHDVDQYLEIIDPTREVIRREESGSVWRQDAAVMKETVMLFLRSVAVAEFHNKSSQVGRKSGGINSAVLEEIGGHRAKPQGRDKHSTP